MEGTVSFMAKKNKPIMKSVCSNCGKTPPKDEAMSTKNWDVYPCECPYCGGRTKTIFCDKDE